ncbi:MAG TPA: phosphatase PAP2 family protein [Bacteroidales bacterium]
MLERLDQQLFLFLNSLNSPFCDQVMHALSGRIIWVPLYLAILIYLGVKYKRKFFIILIFIIVAATLSDQASVLFKNLVHRLRPCYEPSLQGFVHVFNGDCGGKYSFVSSHATNSFDVALLSLLFIKKRWYSICIILWALVIGYSRIYLGVHYPGDVICGSLLGALIGWSVYNLYVLTDNKILKYKPFFNTSSSPNILPPIPPKGGLK